MSFFPAKDPIPGDARSSDAVSQVIVPRSVDLGGFQVHRALPSAQSRMVGPFIFFDHFGPAVFRAGDGVDPRLGDCDFGTRGNSLRSGDRVWSHPSLISQPIRMAA